jgi:hypothetical protein
MAAGPDGILPSISRRNPENEFDLLKQIGSGTYGEVYKVGVVHVNFVIIVKSPMVDPPR